MSVTVKQAKTMYALFCCCMFLISLTHAIGKPESPPLALPVGAGNTLSAGDIAIVGFNTDSPDGFSFIALTSIPAGEIVYFTDQGWNSSGNTWYANSDPHLEWTSPAGGLAQGTIVSIVETGANTFSVSSGNVTIASGGNFSLLGGDSMIAYQSSSGAAPASPVFLAALLGDDNYAHTAGCDDATTKWLDCANCTTSGVDCNTTSLDTSGLPSGLTNGVNAVALFPIGHNEQDNSKYTGSLTGTPSEVLESINNRDNWSFSDTNPYDLTTGYSTVNISSAYSGPILSDGDIVFTRINIDDESFSFVLLVDLSPSTEFFITDEGWNGSSFYSIESTIKFVVNSAVTAGEEVHVNSSTMFYSTTSGASPFTMTSVGANNPTSGNMLGAAGDNLFAYQSGPIVIAGLSANTGSSGTSGNAWSSSSGGTSPTLLPSGKTNGQGGFLGLFPVGAAQSEVDNARYKTSALHSGDKATILQAIMDLSNWEFDNTTPFGVSFTPFSISSFTPPTVSTSSASGVTSGGATLGGNVTNDGGETVIERGVVYALTGVNSDPKVGGTGVTQDSNGSGTGIFSEGITGLLSSAQYSFAAYAVNGQGISYGSVQTFTTLNNPPVIGGTVAGQAVSDNATISPFSSVTITEPEGSNVSATITLDNNAKGVLSGTFMTGTGPYSLLSTTPADLQAKLRALIFNPTDNRTATSETTTFTLEVSDGDDSDIDNTTTVVSGAVAPEVTSVNVPPNATYLAGQNLDFTVNFNENVNVSTMGGIPRLNLTVGATTRYATYISGSGTAAIVFRYTLQTGDEDTDGIAVGALSTNGGTLKDTGGKDVNTTLNSVGSTAGVLVDAVSPEVTSVAVPANDTYLSGENLFFTVNFDENVTVDMSGGIPSLNITIGSTSKQAVWINGSGTSALLFRYTVLAGDDDSNGIVVNSLATNGGTIRDAAGNNATLTLNSVGSTTAVLVDAKRPEVTNVASPNTNKLYGFGESITIDVVFSESITVSGTPQLTLETGTVDRVIDYTSSPQPNIMRFLYTVQTGDESADLDYVSSSALSLNGGSIKDAVNLNADLTLPNPGSASSLGANKALEVNATLPVVTTASASSVSQFTVTLGGEVTYGGSTAVTQRGVVYAENATNNNPEIGGTGVTADANGTGTGTFDEPVSGLSPNTTYAFKAYATNGSGTVYGEVKTVTTSALLTPAITFDDITKTYGDPDFDLNATSNSGGTISYSIVGTANGTSLSGANNETVSLGQVATVTLRATVAANGVYDSGTKDITLTINKATLTATADDKTREYGEANPALTISYSGFKNSEDKNVIDTEPGISTLAVSTTNAGTATISLTGGSDNNYDIVTVDGTLTITKATLTATADDKNREYGEANPALTISYSGFKNSEDKNVIDTEPVASTLAVGTTNAGTATISLTGGSDNNYDIVTEDGTLTITQANLTATVSDESREYGEANPTFTIGYTGFKNGEDKSVIDTEPVASTLAVDDTNAGTITISLTGGSDNNYTFTRVDGTLTITKATLTATADDKTREYGEANPALTISYTGFKNSEDKNVIDTEPGISTLAVSATNAGTATISLTAGSDNNYDIITVDGTLTITKATLTATADDKTREYGEANPALTISYSGFKNSEDKNVIDTEPVASTLAVGTTNAGTATISLTGGSDNNYDIVTEDGTLTITQANLTATVSDESREYGEANPTFTIDYTGFKNGEDKSVIDTEPIASTLAVDDTNAGTITISLTGGSDNNYTFTRVDGTLTITKATLTASADDKTREYGEANPALTISYTGFKNSEDKSVIDTEPGISTLAVSTTNAGTATISLTGGSDNNYDIVTVDGTLTITKATLTATADDKTKEYGHANPTLTISYSGFKNSEDKSVIDTEPSITTTAVAETEPGTVDITLSGGMDNNYDFTLVNGTLTIIDTTPPSGYAVAFDDTLIGEAEAASTSFTLTGAEVGATYDYTITNTALGSTTEVTGTGVVNSPTQQVTSVDVSTLADGEIKVSVTLTDAYDNTGTAATDQSAILDQTRPVVTANQQFNIDENTANATTVGTIAATDNIATTLSNWQIVAGNDEGVFTLAAATGTLTVADKTKLDREAIASYTLTVTVFDGENTSLEQTVSVVLDDVNDVLPVITSGQGFTVSESAANNAVVGTVAATDGDVTPTTFAGWAIAAGNTDGVFAIDAGTGVITVTDNSNLDFETVKNYTLTLTVQDGINTSAQQTVAIEVQDENDVLPVVTASQAFDIDENIATGTELGTLVATDGDVTATVFQNWTIVSGNDAGVFALDAATGQLSIADNATIDFETTTAYTLAVTVGDGINTSTSENVQIDVHNINEQPEIVGLVDFDVDEDNSVTVQFQVTDPDTNVGDLELTAALSHEDLFAVNTVVFGGADADRSVSITPEADLNGTVVLTVTVSDGELSTSQQVTVTVNPVNDTPTRLTLSNDVIDEDVAVGFEVGTLTSTDIDAGESFTYTLVSGDGDTDNAQFAIAGNKLVTAEELDFELGETRTVRVRTTDSGGDFIEESFEITLIANPDLELIIKTAFTPNADGVNDTWVINNITLHPDARVTIFNREGQIMFESVGYKEPWDGTRDGKLLPIDTYYYQIDLNGVRTYEGFVLLLK